MRSMTGYGRGTCEVGGRRFVVELRSVNHRFLEVKQRLPFADPGLEAQVTSVLRSRLDRGAISVLIRDEGGTEDAKVRVDQPTARAYAAALEELRRDLGLTTPVTLELVAAQPGVLLLGEGTRDPDTLFAEVRPGLEAALTELVATRGREGLALAHELKTRVAEIARLCKELGELTREAPEAYRARLLQRLERVLKPGDVDPARLAQEVAIFADRIDVTEELARLGAHVVEFTRLLGESAPAGRRLDFLVQELNRELNTIGSKAQSAQVTARVVDAKAELERLREQIQNIE
jgi:uncharacterized protein (TIGR00255 family)